MARVKIEVPVEASPVQPPVAEAPPAPVHKSVSSKKLVIIVVCAVALLAVVGLVKERNQLKSQLASKSNSSQEVEQIVSYLSQSIELPANEQPASRVIDDAAKFAQQNPSLAEIKNGDMLLFFTKSQQVVVYRPSTKKAVVVIKLAQQPTNKTSNTSQ